MITQKRFDIPFSSDLWISLVMGLMLFITSLSLLVSMGVNQYIQNWNTSVQATYTLELPHSAVPHLQDIISTLKKQPEIQSLELLDKDYVTHLMKEVGVAADETPIFIDVVIDKKHLRSFDADELLKEIHTTVPKATIVKPVLSSPEALTMAEIIESISLGFGLLMIITMCFIITFLMYSEVQTQDRSIGLFNLLGAPNFFISKIFQRYASVIAIKAAILSCVLNICLYTVLYLLYEKNVNEMGLSLSPVTWGYAVIGVPLIMIGIIQLIVPITVLRCLRKKYKTSLNP